MMVMSFALSAQKVLIENDDANHTILKSFDLRSSELQGTPYLNENFLPAKINDIDKLFSMRYDAYTDAMEIEMEGQYYHLPTDADFTIVFTGLDKTYTLNSYEGEKGPERGYFVLAQEGERVSLLIKERVKYHKEVPQNLGFVEYQPPRLKRAADELYFGFPNKSAKKVPRKKREVLKLFGENASLMSDYAKSMQLGFKSPEDLKKLIAYYDTLR
jgi:hypothetical protein